MIATAIAGTGVSAILFARPALGAQTTLTIISGGVSARAAGRSFEPAQDGQLIEAGTAIRTGPGARAVLTFYDGSAVTVEPGSEVVIEVLASATDGGLLVTIQQTLGRTWHVVANRITAAGNYEVRTPFATAAVRGTAFELGITAQGALELETTDGTVATSGGGSTVDVAPGQVTTVAPGQPPAPPRPAPPPAAVVRIALDAGTVNALAVDPSGRSVGVRNGQPLRYSPGSTVEIVDGKLVMTIPTDDPGRISTVVKPAAPRSPVEIETQVLANGAVIARTVERRAPDETGIARGGVVVTTNGVIVLPDKEAREIGAPIIGKVPEAPRALPLVAPEPVAPPVIVTPRPSAAPSTPPPGGSPPPTAGAFLGGFQAFSAGTAAAPSFVPFVGELPRGLVPAPPASRAGCVAFTACDAATVTAPLPTAPPQPAVPPDIRRFLPPDVVLPDTPPGGVPSHAPVIFTPPPGTVPPTGIATGALRALRAGCREVPLFGIVCEAPAALTVEPVPAATRAPLETRAPLATPSGFFPAPLPLATPAFGATPPPTLAPVRVLTPPPIATPAPTPTPSPAIVTPVPIVPIPTFAVATPVPTATVAPVLSIAPIVIVTPPPTVAPTPVPTLTPLLPIIVVTPPPTQAPAPTPAPAPTIAPILLTPLPILVAPTPTPTLVPRLTLPPIFFPGF
ncbi:MAG TPA: FecR domain-containing protein [Candidatus Limnocylindria bacterium]|nr:FecR domain-containing protein [Candidatus Limnocylindria bacterium]